MASTHTASTILPPRLVVLKEGSTDSLEVSVHTMPRQLFREFKHVFSDRYLRNGRPEESWDILAIPTNQRAREDLVAVGEHVEAEKDRLLNVFIEFGRDLCEKLRAQGFWADFVDPCSGLPMLTTSCNKVYSEVDGMECLLNYKTYNAGFCKILTHPKWGSAVYPATIFAYAQSDAVISLIKEYTAGSRE